VANKGYIDAIFTLSTAASSQMSKCFTFEPNEGLISPGGYQAISIQLVCDRLGSFSEPIELSVDGKPEKCKLIMSGTVIPPTFRFDVDKLKFGLISYGKLQYFETNTHTHTHTHSVKKQLKKKT
jgi:hydrocephalus-inducing protein